MIAVSTRLGCAPLNASEVLFDAQGSKSALRAAPRPQARPPAKAARRTIRKRRAERRKGGAKTSAGGSQSGVGGIRGVVLPVASYDLDPCGMSGR
jgi:hypothetical protein